MIVQFDKDARLKKRLLMLGGVAYFATKGVQKASVCPIIRVVVSGEVPVHTSMIGVEPYGPSYSVASASTNPPSYIVVGATQPSSSADSTVLKAPSVYPPSPYTAPLQPQPSEEVDLTALFAASQPSGYAASATTQHSASTNLMNIMTAYYISVLDPYDSSCPAALASTDLTANVPKLLISHWPLLL